MIVKMSKVEIAGSKELLEDTLSLFRESGMLQIEPSTIGFIDTGADQYLTSVIPDEKSISERLFLEDLRKKIEELFSFLPATSRRNSYIVPQTIIDTIAATVEKNVIKCKALHQKRETLQKELAEISRYHLFFDTVELFLKDIKETPDLDFTGLILKDPESAMTLRALLSQLTDDKFDLLTKTASDGTLIGLITTEKKMAEKIKNLLHDENIPELLFPPSFGGLSFVEKISFVKRRVAQISQEIKTIDIELEHFSHRWGPIYGKAKEWLDEKLSLLNASASVFETRMCFFICGWVPSRDVSSLRKQLTERFGGRVILEEKEILEEDLERIPVVLKNPSYFRPFELFTRLLPLPAYSSYDPTPFIGIFFPIFFGMILGDAGYGLILLMLSLICRKLFRKKKFLVDAAKILLIASFYSVLFGILYGEFLGELGHMLFGLKPLYIERRTAVIPMLLFAITVGLVHIILGLFLGCITAMKKKTKKVAVYKLLNILIIVCGTTLALSSFGLFPGLFTKPLIIGILLITPFLLFTGGVLAPLELIKSIGNIISYARIMAIGLTSVLLAFVANRLAGLVGDIVLGIVVAGLLHLINIIIGVFSPTIHSLRLHYVEFFSKFIESGGRKFEPFKRG